MLVNHYEKDVLKWKPEERIYSAFANKNIQNSYGSPISGANISTSKIAILFGYVVTLFWGFILSFKVLDKIFIFSCCCSIYFVSFITSLASIWLLSKFVAKEYLFSKIDHFPNLKLKQELDDSNTNE